MLGPVCKSEVIRDLPACKHNCPRVYPVITADDLKNVPDEDDVHGQKEKQKKKKRDGYDSELGRHIETIITTPCYLMFRILPRESRALRNFIIRNSSCLEVIGGRYCGIAQQVFDVKANTEVNRLALGLVRFKTTEQAYEFSMSIKNKGIFTDENWDLWNLSLCAEDECIVPSPVNPDKFVNNKNVFFMVHICKVAGAPTEATNDSPAERSRKLRLVEQQKQQLEQLLDSVSSHSGRVIVKTRDSRRLHGKPGRVEDTAKKECMPQVHLYLTQWPGVSQFWSWYEAEPGRQFYQKLKEYTDSDYQSMLFTACLDFHDGWR